VWSKILSVFIILAATLGCFGQAKTSLKLIKTISNAELASWDRPFSRQGLLAVRTGNVVQLWDAQTGTVRSSVPLQGKLLDAFFSNDGETFFTSNKEKSTGVTTKLWNVQTGQLKTTLSGLLIYQPISKGLDAFMSLADRNELKFWNAQTGELTKTVRPYKDNFSNSKISFDGRRVIRYGDKKGFLWETDTGRLVAELKPPEQRDILIPWYADLKLWGAVFSPDSKVIATEDSLNSIELWDAETGRLLAFLQGHNSTIYALSFSPDGKLLASASRDGTARIWEVQTGRLIDRVKAGKEIATRVIFNPEGTLLAIGYHTHAKIWDVSRAQVRATLTPHADVNKMVLFGSYLDSVEPLLSPQGKLLLTIGNKSVKVWTITGEPVMTIDAAHLPVSVSADDKVLVTTSRNGSVLLWAIEEET